ACRRFFVLDCARVRCAAELQVALFQSDGGTLLLDAASKMLPVVQQELLTLLGGAANKANPARQFADVHLIACTHPTIAQRMAAREFLEDLYYRLNTMYLLMPAVRERPGDIPALVHYFLRCNVAET